MEAGPLALFKADGQLRTFLNSQLQKIHFPMPPGLPETHAE